MGDYYRLTSPWYYVIQVFVYVYALSTLANLVLVLNISVTNTAFPGTEINVYYTQRYNSMQWWALVFCGAHVLMFPWVMMAITFRRSHGCSVFWFAFMFVLLVGDAFSFIVLTGSYIQCNRNDARNNLCNDARWCCAPDVNAQASNGCPVTPGVQCADWPQIVSSANLSPSGWFVALYIVNLLYFVVDLLIVIFFLGMFCAAPFPDRKYGPKPSAPTLDEEQEDIEERSSATKKETSGLSHRMIQSKYTKPE